MPPPLQPYLNTHDRGEARVLLPSEKQKYNEKGKKEADKEGDSLRKQSLKSQKLFAMPYVKQWNCSPHSFLI